MAFWNEARDDCVFPGSVINWRVRTFDLHRQVGAMRDPFSWSFPIGRMFGISVRIHFLFPLVCLGLILRVTTKDFYPGTWIDMTMVLGLLFATVLFHEFGHCFAARQVG